MIANIYFLRRRPDVRSTKSMEGIGRVSRQTLHVGQNPVALVVLKHPSRLHRLYSPS